MRTKTILDEYRRWIDFAVEDADITEELNRIAGDWEKIEDAFYRSLEFGTGGLRGVIGAGTNRMNIYTVAKASQGLAKGMSPELRLVMIPELSRSYLQGLLLRYLQEMAFKYIYSMS